MPENPTVKDKHFIGYYVKDASGKYVALEREKAVFAAAKEAPVQLFARFVDKTKTENFDVGEYIKTAQEKKTYTIYDFDYEIYDSEKAGNSKDNVTSGRYSLHRKGKNEFFENAADYIVQNDSTEGAEKATLVFSTDDYGIEIEEFEAADFLDVICRAAKNLYVSGSIYDVDEDEYEFISPEGDSYYMNARKAITYNDELDAVAREEESDEE